MHGGGEAGGEDRIDLEAELQRAECLQVAGMELHLYPARSAKPLWEWRGVEVEIYIPWLTKPATASRVDWSDEDAHCLRKAGLPKQRVCSKGIVSSWKD